MRRPLGGRVGDHGQPGARLHALAAARWRAGAAGDAQHAASHHHLPPPHGHLHGSSDELLLRSRAALRHPGALAAVGSGHRMRQQLHYLHDRREAAARPQAGAIALRALLADDGPVARPALRPLRLPPAPPLPEGRGLGLLLRGLRRGRQHGGGERLHHLRRHDACGQVPVLEANAAERGRRPPGGCTVHGRSLQIFGWRMTGAAGMA
mmetsp:Transcript_91083/g.294666  ORF Transcript_91083/g.294666 Transcript_91083/m.294666 type:complete len:208 (-) Transcript_91083:117-740(-)